MTAAASPGGAAEALPGLARGARAGQAHHGCLPMQHEPAAHQHLSGNTDVIN